jgi:hypothetical protein
MKHTSFARGRATQLIIRSSNELRAEHDAAASTRRILNLAPIFGFPVDCNRVWQSVLNLISALLMPSRNRFINTNDFTWSKEGISVLIDSLDEVINEISSFLY